MADTENSIRAAAANRISLSPASQRTLESLSGRRNLSPSPARSPGPAATGSHRFGQSDVSVTSSRSIISSYEAYSEIDDRVVRHWRIQNDYSLYGKDKTTDDVINTTLRSRTLTGTHGDVGQTGYDPQTNQRVRAILEARLAELEEELNNEKIARNKAEKQRFDLKAENSVINERLEAALSANQTQTEITKKREIELHKLQHEIDELHAQHDIQLGTYRKKQQEAVNQLTDQIDRLHSTRQKSDREKIQFRVENEELSQQVELLSKAKIAAEKSSRQFETEVSQLNVKLADLTRELRDVTAQRNYGQQELSKVTARVGDLENQLTQANKAKMALSKRIDELEKIDDDETSTRSRLASENHSLQALVEQLRDQLNTEHESRIDIHRQLTKALNDVASWRQKYESSESAVNPDVEETRKKLSLRLTDCESKLGATQAKLNALEKVNSKLQQETEALVAELDKYQTTNIQQEKRLRQNDKLMEEWQIKMNELTTKLEMSQIEARQNATDSAQWKTQCDESRDHNNSLRRENKSLAEEARDLKEQLRQTRQSLTEVEKTSQRFEAERDSLQSHVEAMESALQQKENKVERALTDVLTLKQDMEKRLADKDEELQNVRKIHQRALDTLQASLDAEARSRMDAVLVKKRLEQDINELELTLDSVNRARGEAEKNWKQCQQELSDLEELLDEEQRSKRTNREEWTLMERKNTTLTGELQELRTQLEVLEKTRKIVEDELRQASDRVTELTTANNSLSISKKKYETDLHNLTIELEERMTELKHTNEQNKRALNDATRLSEELRQQEQSNIQTEKQRRLFEFQVKELQARLEDVENHSVHGAQKTIEKLEQKVHELETELAGEQRRHGETQKSLRRHERRLAELTEQMDLDFKAKEREQDLIDKLQHKMKQYKRQLDEAEEMASVNLAKYRKLQHDLEEAETRARLAEKSLNQHRALSRSSTAVEETVTQTQPGVTVKKTTTTRTHVVSSESRSEQSNDSRVTSSLTSSKSQLAIEQ